MDLSVPVGMSPACMGMTVWQLPHLQIWCEPRWRTGSQPRWRSLLINARAVTDLVYLTRRNSVNSSRRSLVGSLGLFESAYVDRCGFLLPSRKRIDGVDLDEAVPFPEGSGRPVGLIVGRRVLGLRFDEGDALGVERSKGVIQKGAAQPAVAAVSVPTSPIDGGPHRLR